MRAAETKARLAHVQKCKARDQSSEGQISAEKLQDLSKPQRSCYACCQRVSRRPSAIGQKCTLVRSAWRVGAESDADDVENFGANARQWPAALDERSGPRSTA